MAVPLLRSFDRCVKTLSATETGDPEHSLVVAEERRQKKNAKELSKSDAKATLMKTGIDEDSELLMKRLREMEEDQTANEPFGGLYYAKVLPVVNAFGTGMMESVMSLALKAPVFNVMIAPNCPQSSVESWIGEDHAYRFLSQSLHYQGSSKRIWPGTMAGRPETQTTEEEAAMHCHSEVIQRRAASHVTAYAYVLAVAKTCMSLRQ